MTRRLSPPPLSDGAEQRGEASDAHHGLFLLRVAVGAFLAVYGTSTFGGKLRDTASRPEALFHAPLVEALRLPFPPPMLDLWGPLIALLGWMIVLDVAWRVAAVFAAAAVVYVASCISGFGYFNHGTVVIPQLLLVLAVSPGADACSADRLMYGLRRRGRGGMQHGAPKLSEWFAQGSSLWGIKPAGAVLVAMYIASGTSKLRYAPLDWLRGDTLSAYLTGMERPYWLGPSAYLGSALADPPIWSFSYISLPSDLGRAIGAVPELCALLAIGTVAVELFVPFGLLLTPRWRALSCIVLLGFHLIIWQTMGIPFKAWMFVLLGLFPWLELTGAVRGNLRLLSPETPRPPARPLTRFP